MGGRRRRLLSAKAGIQLAFLRLLLLLLVECAVEVEAEGGSEEWRLLSARA